MTSGGPLLGRQACHIGAVLGNARNGRGGSLSISAIRDRKDHAVGGRDRHLPGVQVVSVDGYDEVPVRRCRSRPSSAWCVRAAAGTPAGFPERFQQALRVASGEASGAGARPIRGRARASWACSARLVPEIPVVAVVRRGAHLLDPRESLDALAFASRRLEAESAARCSSPGARSPSSIDRVAARLDSRVADSPEVADGLLCRSVSEELQPPSPCRSRRRPAASARPGRPGRRAPPSRPTCTESSLGDEPIPIGRP